MSPKMGDSIYLERNQGNRESSEFGIWKIVHDLQILFFIINVSLKKYKTTYIYIYTFIFHRSPSISSWFQLKCWRYPCFLTVICYPASTGTVGASARQEFYLIHGSHRIPQWASNHVTLASWGPGWTVTPRHASQKQRRYPWLTLLNRRRSEN